MLNEFFSTCFNTLLPPLLPLNNDPVLLDQCPEDLLCTVDEIFFLLKSLDVSKANGPDGISARMLKFTAHAIAPSLTRLFNISIRLGRFPTCWKASLVVPVPKSSKHQEASNYRPISLLSVLSKLLERHVHHFISAHLKHSHPLSSKQWGFQAGKSTMTALLAIVHDWLEILDAGNEICAVFFDLRKAFDSVPHQPLLDKLANTGLDWRTTSWIRSYLSNRSQQVCTGGETSPSLPVFSGVPQGSILGPLLFLIYIDDVAAISLSQGSTLNLYADDILLYKLIASGSTQEYAVVQSDINIVGNWVDENYLTLNSAKCKYMTISRKRGNSADQVQLSVNGTPLEHVQSFKYLGLTISSDLSWSAHIISTCSKARKLIGLLYRHFYSNTTSESLLELYRAIVRPHLEYAAPVWDPHKLKDVKSLEDTQKFALRMCLKEWSCDYQEVLELSSFPTLQNRRCYQKLTTLFKIVNHLLVFPPDKVQKKHQARPSLHLNSDHMLHHPFARTTASQFSFIPHTVSVWNNLPSEALQATSLRKFKSSIAPLLL